LEAGVHFGHQKHRWNPKMGNFIFGVRNNLHIVDLAQTVPLLHQALVAVSDTVAAGGRVLFVGTKRQAQEPVAEAARRSAQYFVNARWLGGMLTNWKTISNSISRLKELEDTVTGEGSGLTKKERLTLDREREKLERNLGGIKDMGGLPDLVFVIDTNREANAILESNRLNIPVAAVLDTNCDPAGITYPIPGNDDAGRAITLYCDLMARSAIDGISRAQGAMGVDVGAAETVSVEPAVDGAPPVSAAPETAAPVVITTGDTQSEPAAEATDKPAQTEAPEPKAPEPKEAAEPKAPEPKVAETEATEPEVAEPEVAEPEAVKTEAAETPVVELVRDAAEEQAPESLDGEAVTPLFTAPEGDNDDLKKISGVGPVLEGKLNALGITRFSQIAEFSDDQVNQVDEHLNFRGRIEREDWISQAKALVGKDA
jgi:small subunit ribosomal protein S2